MSRRQFSGTIEEDGGVVEAVHVDLDVVSLHTGSDQRDGHLESADFLDIGANAKASFALTISDRTGDDFVASCP
ncbi:YceI family protein [Gemmatimonas sp.]|uniref:YceI family protein n=1 Tax=Gemmatimonas sp. TaxID=1962908 RepID=UPI0035672F25